MEYYQYKYYKILCRLYNTKCKTIEFIKISKSRAGILFHLDLKPHNPKGPSIIYYKYEVPILIPLPQ